MKRNILTLAVAAAALSGFTITGCSTDESRQEAVADAAYKSRTNYDEIDARIDTAVGKLKAADNDPGTPAQYRGVIRDVSSEIRSLSGSAESTCRDIREANESRLAHIRKDASEHSNNTDSGNAATRFIGADAASRQAARMEKLRKYQNAFLEDSAKLGVRLKEAEGSLCDVESTVSANLVDESVRLSKSSLSDALSHLRDAKSTIADLRKDLADIRDYNPQSIDR